MDVESVNGMCFASIEKELYELNKRLLLIFGTRRTSYENHLKKHIETEIGHLKTVVDELKAEYCHRYKDIEKKYSEKFIRQEKEVQSLKFQLKESTTVEKQYNELRQKYIQLTSKVESLEMDFFQAKNKSAIVETQLKHKTEALIEMESKHDQLQTRNQSLEREITILSKVEWKKISYADHTWEISLHDVYKMIEKIQTGFRKSIEMIENEFRESFTIKMQEMIQVESIKYTDWITEHDMLYKRRVEEAEEQVDKICKETSEQLSKLHGQVANLTKSNRDLEKSLYTAEGQLLHSQIEVKQLKAGRASWHTSINITFGVGGSWSRSAIQRQIDFYRNLVEALENRLFWEDKEITPETQKLAKTIIAWEPDFKFPKEFDTDLLSAINMRPQIFEFQHGYNQDAEPT